MHIGSFCNYLLQAIIYCRLPLLEEQNNIASIMYFNMWKFQNIPLINCVNNTYWMNIKILSRIKDIRIVRMLINDFLHGDPTFTYRRHFSSSNLATTLLSSILKCPGFEPLMIMRNADVSSAKKSRHLCSIFSLY